MKEGGKGRDSFDEKKTDGMYYIGSIKSSIIHILLLSFSLPEGYFKGTKVGRVCKLDA